jgi:hypothetical protein
MDGGIAMREAIIKVLISALVILSVSQYPVRSVWAQDAVESADQPVVSEPAPQAEQKAAPQPVVQKPVVQKAVPVVQPTPAGGKPQMVVQPSVASQKADGLSLIEVNDGDFRYTRIQGMTFPKKDQLNAGQAAVVNAVDSVQEKSKSINTTSLMIWGIVLVMVILIFFMYRFGKKKRRGNVFRRFP